MSPRSLLTGRMVRAELLALAMILMAFPGLSAQVASEGGTDRLEIDGVIEGAGHLCLVDRPEYLAEAMLDFITEHRGLVEE